MNEQRLTRRELLGIAVAGLITAIIALAVTIYFVGSTAATYRAQAQVALVPPENLAAEEIPAYWEALNGGQASTVAAQVFGQSQWLDPAAAAAGVDPTSLTSTAGVVESTNLINITMEGPSPEAAETALDTLITSASEQARIVSGPYRVLPTEPAAGTAVPSGVSATQLLIVIFAGGLLIGSGVALLVTRARRRPEDAVPTDYDDEWPVLPERAAPGGYRPRQPMDEPVTGRYPSTR